MQNSISVINKSFIAPSELFVENNGKHVPERIMTCQMGGDSMQPTIQPCELVAFVDCCGRITTPGIYVFTRDVFGRRCLFIKRVQPMVDGALMIISDNHHYQTFTLDNDEQSDMQVHGRVVASMTMRRFV